MRAADASASSTVKTCAFLKISSGMVPSSLRLATSGPSSGPPKDPDHGIEGTLAVCARMLAAILSPSTYMTGPVGPMNLMPLVLRVLGSRGFSEAWPQPGQTASTCSRTAMSTMRSTLA
jgi:hypothetical protein